MGRDRRHVCGRWARVERCRILSDDRAGRGAARQSERAAAAARARSQARRRPPGSQRRTFLRSMGSAHEDRGGVAAVMTKRLLIMLMNTDPRNVEELGAPFYY